MRHVQPLYVDTGLLQPLFGNMEFLLITGNDQALGRIDRSDGDSLFQTAQSLPHAVLGCMDSRHGAVAGNPLHQAAAPGDEFQSRRPASTRRQPLRPRIRPRCAPAQPQARFPNSAIARQARIRPQTKPAGYRRSAPADLSPRPTAPQAAVFPTPRAAIRRIARRRRETPAACRRAACPSRGTGPLARETERPDGCLRDHERGCPGRAFSKAPRSSSEEEPVTAKRCSKWARPALAVKHISPTGVRCLLQHLGITAAQFTQRRFGPRRQCQKMQRPLASRRPSRRQQAPPPRSRARWSR